MFKKRLWHGVAIGGMWVGVMIVGSISAPTIKATSLSDLRPIARHVPQLSAIFFKGPFALNDDGQGGADNLRRW
jgi:hypothetical protein